MWIIGVLRVGEASEVPYLEHRVEGWCYTRLYPNYWKHNSQCRECRAWVPEDILRRFLTLVRIHQL